MTKKYDFCRYEVHQLSRRAWKELHVGQPGAGQDHGQGVRAQGRGVPSYSQYSPEVSLINIYQKIWISVLPTQLLNVKNETLSLVLK